MNAAFFLSLHVLAAILTIGPVAVAASMFPRYVRTAPQEPKAPAILAVLHRICRVYTVIGLTVPAFGLATAASLGVLTDAWLLTSIGLTAVAAAVLLLAVLPQQSRALAALDGPGTAGPANYTATTADDSPSTAGAATAARLGAATGVFNLLWAVVVVLMIVRPGSTTGV
ncbi:hypothetical protein [Cryptosporangium japonicum]|uniref:hypothetical protein n=1 Tax=Cryptosporangium japonicum TaxID=80872 RepID=UPI0031DA0FFB